MATAIKTENLSKIYRLGEIGTGTISRDLERWWAKMRGKEDPFLKIGQANDRAVKGESDIVYSLRDINFEIQQGEAVGIIGKNGAGKSTLLKILSRVTSPTTGKIEIKGRIASLLEVGTGFHPELTGRENIYLNGAILGMRKKEITRKLDEIIDFSGVERYIDTPVKRYSSGMYVRLAFAVAAHLESEVLIVDEVLAVGDADFQKKCLGKMKDVSTNDGRTILFVSHNLSAIKSLCKQGIILDKGIISYNGDANTAVSRYLSGNILDSQNGEIPHNFYRKYSSEICKFTRLLLLNNFNHTSNAFLLHETITFEIGIEAKKKIDDVCISVIINSNDGQPLVFNESLYKLPGLDLKQGINEFTCSFKNELLSGTFTVTLAISYAHNGLTLDYVERLFEFNTLNASEISQNYKWSENHGLVYADSEWKILTNGIKQ